MTNYDITLGLGDFNFQRAETQHQTLSRIVDFSKFTTAGAAGSAADTADVITIPANFVVEDVYVTIKTASTTTSSTFGVGDAADSVYYLPNTTDATATAGTVDHTVAGASGKFKDVTSATTLANSMEKVYTTASTLRVVLGSTAPQNGKIKIDVRGFYLV